MKKVLLSTIVLLLFSVSVLLFQLSCKKDAKADSGIEKAIQLNKIIYEKFDTQTETEGFYVANYDGSNETKLNITLPALAEVHMSYPRISPSGQNVFFVLEYTENDINFQSIYSCGIDGTNLRKIVDGQGKYEFDWGGVY